MKKTLTTTFRMLLFTVALTFVAPIATFAQFTATWYDTGWESQSQDFTSLSDALSYDYNDVLMSMGVSITQTADYTSTTSSSVTIANGVTSIGRQAFNGCGNMTSITIPASVNLINSSAFYNCNSLTSVYISDLAA